MRNYESSTQHRLVVSTSSTAEKWKFFELLLDPPHDSLGAAHESWFG